MSTTAKATPTSPFRGWWDADRLADGRLVRKVWLIGRLVLLLEWVAMRFTLGDTRYYFEKITALDAVGPRETMIEYPTPVVWLLKLPDLLTFGHRWVYVVTFVAMMFALDAAFTRSLWTHGGRQRGRAVLFWAVFVPLVGTTAYLRFDILTAVLAGWGVLELARRRPALSGALIGLGAAIKLWPALLWPALLGREHHQPGSRWRATVGVFGFGGLLALASLWWAGWDRLISPLGWQSDRGLQIESIWAMGPMLLRMVDPERYHTEVSSFNAWELDGPGTAWGLHGSSIATALGMALAVAAYLMWLRRGRGRLVEAAALMLLVILIMIVTNKTFSPQYIIWLGGPLAAGWAVSNENPAGSAQARADEHDLAVVSEWTFVATLLTQLVYPIGYASLVQHRPGLVVATLVLTARNLVLCLLAVRVGLWVWRFVRPSATGEPDAPQLPESAPEADAPAAPR